MTITTDNYELYFYQYAEGELDAAGREAVEAFAAQHPELAAELALYDPALKLAEPPMPCPNKECLLHRERLVLPLWRWAAAACVAAVLIGGAWLVWPSPSDGPAAAEVLVAEQHPADTPQLSDPVVETVAPATVQHPSAPSQVAVAKAQPVPAAVRPLPQAEEPEPLPAPALELGTELLAEAQPALVEVGQDTLVIEYIDMVLSPEIEIAQADPDTRLSLGQRYRNLRSRVANTIRDYAYKSYVETRGELLAWVND